MSETLDEIFRTNSDTSYIAMANDLFSDLSNEDNDVSAGSITDAEDTTMNQDLVSDFLKSQEDELLISLYT